MEKRRKKIVYGYGDAKSICQLYDISAKTLWNYANYITDSEKAKRVRDYMTKNLRRPVIYVTIGRED